MSAFVLWYFSRKTIYFKFKGVWNCVLKRFFKNIELNFYLFKLIFFYVLKSF